MRLNLKTQRKSRKISLTPLIDVVFLLLVFFMLSSTFLKFLTVQIDGGKASADPSLTKNELIIIHVHKDNKIIINKDEVALIDMREKLNALKEAKAIDKAVIKSDEGVNVQQIIEVLQSAKGSNLKDVMLVR